MDGRAPYGLMSSIAPKRILIMQRSLQPPGGGNAVGVWMIQALAEAHDVSVLTWQPVDVNAIDRYYGTSLSAWRIRRYQAPAWLRLLVACIPLSTCLFQMHVLQRLCKRMAGRFDLVLSAQNEADLGCEGIQYVHFPWDLHPRPDAHPRWYQNRAGRAVIETYYRICRWISGYRRERMKRNLTLVNSDWTGTLMRRHHGMECQTLYPPAPGEFPQVSWEERKVGFLCLGRIAPEKEIAKLIRIIAGVRAHGVDVQLHIVGSRDDRYPRHYNEIERITRKHGHWISLRPDQSRTQVCELIARHRYGIHGMQDEHFGMAVAEMMRGGCVVFVPANGGQMEIVGHDPRLVYRSEGEAVDKILQVMRNDRMQSELRRMLAMRSDLFTPERFMHRVRETVSGFATPRPRELLSSSTLKD